MRRATLTLLQDDTDLVARLVVGDAVDLIPGERNTISSSVIDARILADLAGHRLADIDIHIALQGDRWTAKASSSGHGIVVDSKQLATTPVALDEGALIDWPKASLCFRFNHVDDGALARRVFVPGTDDLLLIDCHPRGARTPGRWSALRRHARGIERVHVVAGPSPRGSRALTLGYETERALATPLPSTPAPLRLFPARLDRLDRDLTFRVFDAVDGVPLALLIERVGALEPTHALRLAHRACAWLAASSPQRFSPTTAHPQLQPDVLVLEGTHFVVTWDGRLAVRPPLVPRLSTSSVQTRDFLIASDLLELLAPEWIEQGRALHGAAPLATALYDAFVPLRQVAPEELADIVRNAFPDQWRAEQQLREELALLDGAGRAALFTP